MSTPSEEIDNRFARRKLEAELGRFFVRMASITEGLRDSVRHLTEVREAMDPRADGPTPERRSTGDLAALLIEKLEEPDSAERQEPALRLLHRVQDLSTVADDLARGIFATGIFCEDRRNVHFRIRPGRSKEFGLSLERVRAVAQEADQIEMSLVALSFAIRTDRSFEQAFRTIHPRLAIFPRDRGTKEA